MITKKLLERLRRRKIEWQYTPQSRFEFYGTSDDVTVRLRLNDFPDEPLCTLILNGDEADLEEWPSRWTLPKHRGEE